MTKTSHRGSSDRASNGIPIGSPGAPTENTDAGSGADLHREYMESMVRRYRGTAKRCFARARKIIGYQRQAAEREARNAIDCAVKAFWWAEGTEMEEAQHELMHRIGKWTRRSFGCRLLLDDKGYHRTCTIDIAHIRLGLSIGFIASRICSLCDEDLSECIHIAGRTYWMRGGAQASGPCRVCNKESCAHRPDRLYRAPVISIVKEGELREISYVPRPANPEARITNISVSSSDLIDALGSRFVPGMPVSCNKCLAGCPGFSTTDEGIDDIAQGSLGETEERGDWTAPDGP